MPDTVRTDAEILALLADNSSGKISAQAVRDAYVSLLDRIDKADMPDAFTFTDVTDAFLGAILTHADITVTGSKVPSLARTTGALTFSVNGGSFVAEAVVQAGDVITPRMQASPQNLTEVTGTLNVGGRSDTWSVTTGNYWTIDDSLKEALVFGFFQEDVLEGAVTSWVSRGVKPKTANGSATKLANNAGVFFAKGTAQTLQWAVDTDAPFIHRTWFAIARADLNGNPGHAPASVLTIHSTTGQAPTSRQPNIRFVTTNQLGVNCGKLGHSVQSAAADGAFANWNFLVGGLRGGKHWARINGTVNSVLDYPSFEPNNTSLPSWLGGGEGSAPGTVAVNLAIDCAGILQGELSDDAIDKIEGYLAHRCGRIDLLPSNHPYKAAAPTPGGTDIPTLYVHDANAWAAFDAASPDVSNFGLTAPTANADYTRVFFDDFLIDSVVDDVTSDVSSVWFCPTLVSTIGKNATARKKSQTPAAYAHDATPPGFVSMILQESVGSPPSGIFYTGAFGSVNKSGLGRWWGGECRFVTRVRWRNIPPMPASPGWPGFFPAWWFYGKEHFFWRTRRRLEYDVFEHEGGLVEDDRIAQALHTHESAIDWPAGDLEPGYSASGMAGSAHLNTTTATSNGFPRNWPVNHHSYDGNWHTYEWRVESDFIYTILNGLEVGRKANNIDNHLLHPKFMLFDFALFTNVGSSMSGQGPFYFDVDYVEVWRKETDLSVVPTGFSARPTLSGSLGGTITLTPNTDTSDQLEIRWYRNHGEPLVGQTGLTFNDSGGGSTSIRAHVRNLSLNNQPEAWTAEMIAGAFSNAFSPAFG